MGSREERAKLLAETAVFSGLSAVECQQLAPVSKARVLDAGEVVFNQGETGDYLAVVNKGELVVEVDDGSGEYTEMVRLGRGEAVGEMSSLDPAPRSATVSATEPTQILVLTRTMLDSLRVNAPGLFSRVVRQIAHSLARMLDKTNALITDLLKVKRAPTQPRQPSLQQIQSARSEGRSIKRNLPLPAAGVINVLSQSEREVLRAVTVGRRYEAGEVICMEGAPASEAYFVVEGSVDVLKHIGPKNYRLAQTGVGAFLGQRALLQTGSRSATLRAGIDGATIMALGRDKFDALLEAESPLAIRFQEAVTIAGIKALRQANEMAAYLGARESKRQIPRPKSNRLKGPTKERIQEFVDADEDDDIATLASVYLETALAEWDMTPSELDRIEVVTASGELSAAEKKARAKKKGS